MGTAGRAKGISISGSCSVVGLQGFLIPKTPFEMTILGDRPVCGWSVIVGFQGSLIPRTSFGMTSGGDRLGLC